MEFKISSAELLKGLLDVSKAIPTKAPLPILENFLFRLSGGVLEITASDSELTLRTAIEVESVKAEGAIAVNARLIIDLLKELPDQPISLKDVSASSFECGWLTGHSALPCFPAEDYPEIKGAGEDAQQVTFKTETLIEGINGTIYAAADDPMRPQMNGIFFDIDTTSTTLVASDSHKLICYTAADVQSDGKYSFILAKKSAAILKSIIGKDVENVQITLDQNTAVFTFGVTTMICRLIVAKFPAYRSVIPQNNSNVLKIDRIQLLNTIKRIAVCAQKATNHIKLDLKENQLELTAQDLGFGIAAYEKITCEYHGEELSIGFKSQFLSEILSNMICENIVIKFADARRAVLVVPSEEEEAAAKFCGLCMPVVIS
ncbi:MAG: DNA polymerase III subunit beta [Bacteroidales bacterium]|nr:DNA polymerase III subunit beta [Bacteroidales bacterium]